MQKRSKKRVFPFPGIFKLLFSRVVMVSLSIVAQIVVLVLTIFYFRNHYAWFYALFTLTSAVVVLVVVNNRTNPAYQIAWLIPILLVPVFGVMLYLTLGGNRLSPRLKRRMQGLIQRMQGLPEDPAVQAALEQTDRHAAAQSSYLTRYGGGPVYNNTDTTYFPSAESCFADILARLREAQEYIYLEYFIIAQGTMWEQVLEILKQKAAEGVDVRVIYDDFGSITRLPGRYARQLEAMGIQCGVFNPYIPILSGRLNNRDHRKLLIIDGRLAYTGGLNLADEYINVTPRFGHWKDNGILVEGSAAWSMTIMFLAMWEYLKGLPPTRLDPPELPEQTAPGFVQPYTDNPLDGEEVGQTVYHNLMGHALDHIWVMTPYLVIDHETRTSLTAAAKSGVDVRIITPGVPDKWYVHAVTRSNYDVLLEAGVRIFEYTPGFIHSKVFAVDGKYATVGTINLDYRSLYLHFENGVWLYGTDSIAQVEADFQETFPQCREITLADSPSGLLRLGRAILRVFAPLM